MVTKLALSGNELIAYAVVYGFSQADEQYCTCTQEYIAEWCGISRVSINRILQQLIHKNMIVKMTTKYNGTLKKCYYKAIIPDGDDNENILTSDKTSLATSNKTLLATSNKTLLATSNKTLLVTSNKMLHNNIDIYNNNNKSKSKSKNSFNDFQQHDYDFEQIEKMLVNKGVKE